MAKTARTTISCGFGSLMDIDKLIQFWCCIMDLNQCMSGYEPGALA